VPMAGDGKVGVLVGVGVWRAMPSWLMVAKHAAGAPVAVPAAMAVGAWCLARARA